MVVPYYSDLRGVFSNYAQSDVSEAGTSALLNNTMNIDEFWSFIRDSKVQNKNFKASHVESIFNFVLKQHQDPLLVAHEAEKEITSSEFIRVIIRVAQQRRLSPSERRLVVAEIRRDCRRLITKSDSEVRVVHVAFDFFFFFFFLFLSCTMHTRHVSKRLSFM
jgi:hypothetical protein